MMKKQEEITRDLQILINSEGWKLIKNRLITLKDLKERGIIENVELEGKELDRERLEVKHYAKLASLPEMMIKDLESAVKNGEEIKEDWSEYDPLAD